MTAGRVSDWVRANRGLELSLTPDSLLAQIQASVGMARPSSRLSPAVNGWYRAPTCGGVILVNSWGSNMPNWILILQNVFLFYTLQCHFELSDCAEFVTSQFLEAHRPSASLSSHKRCPWAPTSSPFFQALVVTGRWAGRVTMAWNGPHTSTRLSTADCIDSRSPAMPGPQRLGAALRNIRKERDWRCSDRPLIASVSHCITSSMSDKNFGWNILSAHSCFTHVTGVVFIRPHRLREIRTIAIDDPVASTSVSLSICKSVRLFLLIRHFDAAVASLP